jgi:hypothetical protein
MVGEACSLANEFLVSSTARTTFEFVILGAVAAS